MPFDSWGYHFEGAFSAPRQLPSGSGVYVIWCKDGDNWKVLDVGESDDVRDRVMNHKRADCWSRNCSGIIHFAATYTLNLTESKRREIEQDIRNRTNPPCGEF